MSDHHVVINYINWKGELTKRTIHPIQLKWTSNEWHKEPQWLLVATDMAKGEYRTFAMKNIHSWEPVNSPDAG